MQARQWIRGLIVAGVLAGFAGPAAAQDPSKHFTFATLGGWTFWDTEQPLKDALYVGGRLGARMRYLGLEVAGGFSPTKVNLPGGAEAGWVHGSGNLMLFPLPGSPIEPYAFGGVGGEHFGGPAGSDHWDLTVDAGGGLLARLNESFGLRFEARDVLLVQKRALFHSHVNDWAISGGLTIGFGGHLKDSDWDGVSDKRDRCPDTPNGCRVDANGCPSDADSDGVCDGVDTCPNTPKGATVDAKGCTRDTDGDGVPDGIDACPSTPAGATVDARGCTTDSDNDGVADGLDKCPNSPRNAIVDSQGCPLDTDNDGVFDGLDKCPNTPMGAKVDRDGCPIEIMDKETELLDTGMIRLQNVNFETAKAEILPESYPVLDVVGQLLSRWPELRIEIGGHTDSRGSNLYNQRLSKLRAGAVLDYLLSHFKDLRPEQYTAKGYGEARPLVPNTSALNMAKNRRVEFVVTNKDVLKREKERRRLLQRGEGAPADTTQH
jgi:outer membrane protein OmpA-like peptidoglycan-associated protein